VTPETSAYEYTMMAYIAKRREAIERRRDSFLWLCDLFDRATYENNLDLMRKAYDALNLFYRG